jgi:hypothetical protein
MHFVLDPRSMPDNLIAARGQPTLPLRLRIWGPGLRQIAGGEQARQRSRVDLVRLHPRMRDRLHLQRIGDHHPLHKRRQNARDCHAIPGRLDHHLVVESNLPPSPSRAVRVISTRPRLRSRPSSQITTSPKVRWRSMPITLLISHLRSIFTGAVGDTTPTDSRSRRNRASRRGGQLLTRALSSSNTSACPHFRAPGASFPDGRTIRRRLFARSQDFGAGDPHTGYERHRILERQTAARRANERAFSNR